MTSVHNYPSSQPFAKQPTSNGYASSINGWSSSTAPRKNSLMMGGAQTPVLSSFAIDLIAQAKALKEALKDASGFEAEQALQREQEELEREELLARVKALGSRTSLESDRSGKSSKSGKSPKLKGFVTSSSSLQNNTTAAGVAPSAQPEKKSRLERIFSKKAFSSSSSSNNNKSSATLASGSRPLKDQAHAHSNGSTTLANNSSTDLAELRYLPVDEENEEMYIDEVEFQIGDRSMSAAAGVGQSESQEPETQVKLHPTRAKVFSLPKSIRKLKRRIAALRAKGVDVNKDQNADTSAQDQGEKKKFRLIRLLPWKSSSSSSKKPATTA
ncbi:hypothetical protein BGW42_008694 [Actinomortierella wolfii]|nr:hypothetical protein BGW42_008694 [Actinomortierella wolfii]